MVKRSHATHEKELVSLRRIEGQIRGLQKMIAQKEYCVDIITQTHAAIHALYRVSENIFSRHLEYCVTDVFQGNSSHKKKKKADEIVALVRRLHKL